MEGHRTQIGSVCQGQHLAGVEEHGCVAWGVSSLPSLLLSYMWNVCADRSGTFGNKTDPCRVYLLVLRPKEECPGAKIPRPRKGRREAQGAPLDPR